MIRLYLEQIAQTFKLHEMQVHYLRRVMRQTDGSHLHVFNNQAGEWAARLEGDCVVLLQQTRLPATENSKSIAIACIKRQRLEYAVEKVTELGIDDILLVNTERSQRINYDIPRLRRITIEAAEQSGRISIPTIHLPITLVDLLNNRTNFFLAYQEGCSGKNKQWDGAIIGPEGGWSNRELDLMNGLDKVKLSQSILRSETASVLAASILTTPHDIQQI